MFKLFLVIMKLLRFDRQSIVDRTGLNAFHSRMEKMKYP